MKILVPGGAAGPGGDSSFCVAERGLPQGPASLFFSASSAPVHAPNRTTRLTTKASERRPNPVPRPYKTPDPAITKVALAIAQRLDEKQAKDIVVLDVSGPFVIADYFVIATVQSTRQAQALRKELDLESKATRGRRRRNTGGLETEESNWVLLDFDDVVVHLFLPEAREYYGLETLWADVPRLPFTPAPVREVQRSEIRHPVLDGLAFGGTGLEHAGPDRSGAVPPRDDQPVD